MRRLFTFMLFVTGAFLWATETMVAEAASSDCVVDTRTTLGARLVHGTVRVSPVSEEANNGTTLLIDDTAPEWSPETPLWNSTTVDDGVHEAALYETEDPAKARLVVLNDDNYVYESGSLEGDVTWNNDAIHIVQYGVQIPEDSTLTVSEGTVVKLCQGADLIANGTMTAGKGAVFGNLSEAEITGQEITVDEELSEDSPNPVQNQAITAAINSLKAADTELAGQIGDLDTKDGELAEEIAGLKTKDGELAGQISTLEGTVAALSKKDEELAEEIAGLKTEDGKLAGQISTLDGKVVSLQNDNKTIAENIGTLQSSNSTLTENLGTLQDNVDELKTTVSGLMELPEDQGEAGQVLTKTEEGFEWKTPDVSVDDALSETSENAVQNKVVTAALNELTGADATMNGALSAMQSTLAAVQQDVGALQAGSAALETTLGTQQTAITEVKADMSSLQTANQTRDAAISALQADNAELKSQLTILLALLNGGKEGQVLSKGKDGSLVWIDLKAQDTEVKTLALEAGWNLVAMPGRWLVEESDQALLDEIKIYTYDRETQVFTHTDGLKPLTSYWFYAKEPCTIHFAVIADEAK